MSYEETTETFPAMLRRVLGERLAPNLEVFPDMFAPDGVLEYPFAPPGISTPMVGREAIVANFERIRTLMTIDSVFDVSEIDVADPDTIVLEFRGRGRGAGKKTNEVYDQRYVSVIHLREGRFVRYKDYWNPIEVVRVIKGSDKLLPLLIE